MLVTLYMDFYSPGYKIVLSQMNNLNEVFCCSLQWLLSCFFIHDKSSLLLHICPSFSGKEFPNKQERQMCLHSQESL